MDVAEMNDFEDAIRADLVAEVERLTHERHELARLVERLRAALEEAVERCESWGNRQLEASSALVSIGAIARAALAREET
jgi:hypothetical protein